MSAGRILPPDPAAGESGFRAALGLRTGDLVQAGDPDTYPAQLVVRADQRKRLQVAEGGLIHELLTPNLQGALGMLRTEVPAGFSNEDAPFRHPGEECVHVLEGGPLEVSVAGRRFELAGEDGTAEAEPPVAGRSLLTIFPVHRISALRPRRVSRPRWVG